MNLAVRSIKWPGRANLIVSLVSIHHGLWSGVRTLDSKTVSFINAFLDEEEDSERPVTLRESRELAYKGSDFMGDGFVLSLEDAEAQILRDERLRDVIVPLMNGDNINNSPTQSPRRAIINFYDWTIEKAQQYTWAYDRVLRTVKPTRDSQKDLGAKEKWWRYLRPRMELYGKLKRLDTCFVVTRHTKYLAFSSVPAQWVFTDALSVFTTDRWDLFAVLHSALHEYWARKYSGALKLDLRYSATRVQISSARLPPTRENGALLLG